MRTQPLCMLPLVRPGFLQRAPRHSAPPAVFPRTSSETRSRELVFPMNVGAPFNPYKVFQGAFAPYWVLEHRGISAGAKLCYIRLLGFAGKEARCYPSLATLGAALGVSDRQARECPHRGTSSFLLSFAARLAARSSFSTELTRTAMPISGSVGWLRLRGVIRSIRDLGELPGN